MADYNKILKCWATVEADFPHFGDMLMTRTFIKYPEVQKLCDPKTLAVAPGDMAGNQYVTALGVTRLKHIGDMLRTRGNHTHLHINNMAVTRITEILLDILCEKCGLDAAGQQDLKKVMAVCWEDIRVVCRKNGAECP